MAPILIGSSPVPKGANQHSIPDPLAYSARFDVNSGYNGKNSETRRMESFCKGMMSMNSPSRIV